MSITKVEVRRGAYYDSIVLMQLQVSLAKLPGVLDAGAMMGVAANKELLRENGLLTAEAEAASADDLILSLKCEDAAAAESALARVDTLLATRPKTVNQAYLPKSLEAAAGMAPEAAWALVSVPGSYASGVAREALRRGKHVFLYSDNVTVEDEISLKKQARDSGLLLMGPDCGTAIINGVGFGFANQVRRGPIGLVGASGTGLQHVSARIEQLSGGITHALGTGGRDLSRAVGGITAMQGLELLRQDAETRVVVLISKPPAAEVTTALLRQARQAGKPVVVYFIGYPAGESRGNLYFARSLDETAQLAVELAAQDSTRNLSPEPEKAAFAEGLKFLRGLFSGGTLAQESLLILRNYLPDLHSNLTREDKPDLGAGHAIVDLGEDEFTVGRPHPMLDNTLRLQRLAQEAADPRVAMILLDVVLGHGAHPDPASELAPAISEAIASAKKAGRHLEVVALVVGTDGDPQDMPSQMEQLRAAGAKVETSVTTACVYVGERLQQNSPSTSFPPVDPSVLTQPVSVLNIGLESFAASVAAQGGEAVHVDWRPPAGGNEKLMSILERMRKK